MSDYSEMPDNGVKLKVKILGSSQFKMIQPHVCSTNLKIKNFQLARSQDSLFLENKFSKKEIVRETDYCGEESGGWQLRWVQ